MELINVHTMDERIKEDMKNKEKFKYEKQLQKLLDKISSGFYMYINSCSDYLGISSEDYQKFWHKDGKKNKKIQEQLMRIIKSTRKKNK